MSDLAIGDAIISAARGTGKTLALGALTLWSSTVLTHPSLPKRLRIGKRQYDCCVIGGSMRQSQKLYEYAKMAATQHKFFEPLLLEDPTLTRIQFEGGTIFPLPASEKAVRSPHTDLLIIDEAVEADEIIEDSFSINSTSQYARTIFSSTPHEALSTHVMYWENADEYGFKKHGPWRASECPWISTKKLTQAKHLLSEEKYTVDILGEVWQSSGAFFRVTDIKACQIKGTPKYNEMYPSYAGIDWGYYPSPTVVTIVQPVGDLIYLLKQYSKLRPNFEDLKGMMLAWKDKYNIVRWHADSSHSGENQRLIKAGLRVIPIKFRSMRIPLLENMKWIVEQQRLRYYNEEKELTTQLRRFATVKKPNQDRIDSLALGLLRLGVGRTMLTGTSRKIGGRRKGKKVDYEIGEEGPSESHPRLVLGTGRMKKSSSEDII